MPKETSPIVIVDGNVLNPHLSFILCVQMFYYVLCTNKCIQISTIHSPPQKKKKIDRFNTIEHQGKSDDIISFSICFDLVII